MGEELAGRSTIPTLLPPFVVDALIGSMLVVAVFHVASIAFIVGVIFTWNVGIGPLIGKESLHRRKKKNVTTFAQEMIFFVCHIISLGIFSAILNGGHQLSVYVIPIFDAIMSLSQNCIIVVLCPELRLNFFKA